MNDAGLADQDDAEGVFPFKIAPSIVLNNPVEYNVMDDPDDVDDLAAFVE